MHNFTIETTLPFPFLEFNELVTYTEVKKPTGIAYTILVLLKESKNKDFKISDLLETYGIPSKLHNIFADTIRRLINQNIIEYIDENYTPINFSKYRLCDFTFTKKGEKIFAEEQIATGVEKECKIKCFFDIASQQYYLKQNLDLEIKELHHGAFDDDFVDKLKCKKSVEDFFNTKKGPSFQVKDAEVITKVELYEKKKYVCKHDCKLIIEGDNLKVKFDYKPFQDFFNSYYTNDMLNKAIILKDKFKLENAYRAKLSSFDENVIYKMILPIDFNSILKQKYQLVLVRKGYGVKKDSTVIDHCESLNMISKFTDFITVDASKVYAYCPIFFEFEEEKLGTIILPLVLVLKPTIEQFSKAIGLYIDTKKVYNYDSFKEIVYICNITKDYKKAITMLESYMSDYEDTNINILNEVKPLLINNNNYLNDYKSLLEKHYNKYIVSITEDSIDTALKITSSIVTFLNLNRIDILKDIMNSIGNPRNTIKLYETLVKSFSKEAVLQFINPIPEILNGGKVESTQLLDVINFNESLNRLKKITEINDYISDSFNEEELIKSDFKKEFIFASDIYKKIKFFKPFNADFFSNVDKFMSIFNTINDNLNVLEDALKNPKNIKNDLIDKKITQGDYQFVLINLSAKLELLLSQKFNYTGNLADKLNQARKEKKLEKHIVSDLHEFRKSRNALAHPEDRVENYTPDDLRRWADEIFKIEEEQ